jgi:hypothetical protein
MFSQINWLKNNNKISGLFAQWPHGSALLDFSETESPRLFRENAHPLISSHSVAAQ